MPRFFRIESQRKWINLDSIVLFQSLADSWGLTLFLRHGPGPLEQFVLTGDEAKQFLDEIEQQDYLVAAGRMLVEKADRFISLLRESFRLEEQERYETSEALNVGV